MALKIACLSVLLAACAPTRLYEGPARPRAEVARLVAYGASAALAEPGAVAYDAWIVGIDGNTLDRPVHRAEVLPGPRRVAVRWERREVPYEYRESLHAWVLAGSGTWQLEVAARAGRSYVLDFPPDWSGKKPGFRER